MEFIELSQLQGEIQSRLKGIEAWVRVEIESHRVSNGHHYLNVIEKAPNGDIAARASARIWYREAGILDEFAFETGKQLEAGMSVVVYAVVDYHPQYGLSLIIKDIDTSFTLGERERQKQESIKKLADAGLMEKQKELTLPFFPSRIAVISSRDTAGYGDFVKHLDGNAYGYKYEYTLFQSLVQGEKAPQSIISCLDEILEKGEFDLVLILRGGGADSDLFCYDDYELCRHIAQFPLPVLTAIGHERDFHIADMVAYDFFKTPTAMSDYLIEWTLTIETKMLDAVEAVRNALRDRVSQCVLDLERSVSAIHFALSSQIALMEKNLALLEAGIKAADPRALLRQGYVLAVDNKGNILKNAGSKTVGDDFSLRFSDGLWECRIDNIKL